MKNFMIITIAALLFAACGKGNKTTCPTYSSNKVVKAEGKIYPN